MIAQELTEAALAVGPVQLGHMRKLGLLNPGVARMGREHHQFGVANVRPIDDGLYVPDGDGFPALVVPVFEDGQLVDLVAFRTAEPERWWLRKGVGGLLGLYRGWSPYEWADNVLLHETPLKWLQAGGKDLCVVDWDATEVHRINTFERVTVSTPGLRSLLLKTLKRPYRLVPVDVVSGEIKNVA